MRLAVFTPKEVAVKPALRSVVAAHLVLVGIVLPVTLHAATQVFTFNFRGSFVHAEFSSTDASGDIQTDVFVDASTVTPAGPSGTSLYPPVASIFINRFSKSTGASLFTGAGGDSMASITVAPDLSSASLMSTMPVQDFNTGAVSSVSVTVTWTATGPQSISTSNVHLGTPQTFFYDLHTKGVQRPAQASGTVLVGGIDFTPAPSLNAMIQSEVLGTVNLQIQKP
jgi:hypothetical protein